MKSTDVPKVIYSVPELKTAFSRLAIDRMLAAQAEPLPKDSKCLSDTSPMQQLAMEVTMSMGAVSHFCNGAFIGLQAVPAELATETDQATKPFHKIYRANEFILMTAEQANQYPSAIRKLG